MFNQNLGTETNVNGSSYISTKRGKLGHVIWGNYLRLQPGRYCVIFGTYINGEVDDPLAKDYGFVDVVTDAGRKLIAKTPILAEALTNGGHSVRVDFELRETTIVEMRAYVHGNQALLVEEKPRPIKLSDRREEDEAIIAGTRFPDLKTAGLPEFFRTNIDRFQELHKRHITVNLQAEKVILNIDGISIHAGELDDLHCLNEIFVSNVYNIAVPHDACVIDIGMNLAFATLFFAKTNNVKEIHSFEPFEDTFKRGMANIELNPNLATKIFAHRLALSDQNEEKTIRVGNKMTTATMSIRDHPSGQSMTVSVRDAGTVLGPIVERAIAKGLLVVAKIDCEGSEYEIFKSLERAGLLQKFSALMVEWHPYSIHKQFSDLANPLLKHGFVVFDRTLRKGGNGMFYAVHAY